jgi:hypothetical protein
MPRTRHEIHALLWAQTAENTCFCRGCGELLLEEQWWFTVYHSENMRYYKCCSSACMRVCGDGRTSCS